MRLTSLRLAALLLGLFATPALAAPAAGTIEQARAYVQHIGDIALGTIADKSAAKEAKQAKLEQLFSDNVDIQWVGRFVMGQAWRTATDDQKARYLTAYRSFLVKNYATRFADYTGGSFKITGAKDEGSGEFVVNMEIASNEKNAEPVFIDYRLRPADKGTFKVFDIIIEGVSMITTQRSEFSSVISNQGLEYLITQLANRSVTLPGSEKAGGAKTSK